MRLGGKTSAIIASVVNKAMSGECLVTIPAPSHALARRMFYGVSPHIERYGGKPASRDLAWRLPNGSEIRIEIAA
jgi:hypothetical protein